MSEQIKMCPYCGSVECDCYTTCAGAKHYVYCDGCGADGPRADNEENAVLLWNAAANQIEALRADLAEAQEQLRLTISREVATHAKLQFEIEQLRKERDEARAWARKLYREHYNLVNTVHPIPICTWIKDEGDTEYYWVYDTHKGEGRIVRNDKAQP